MSQYLIENDEKCDYSFRAITLMKFSCIACVACVDRLNRCNWVLHPKEKKANGFCEGLRSKGYC